MADYVTPSDLAERLGLSDRTVRRAVVDAEERERVKELPPDRRTEREREREQDRSLLTAERTPGGFLRWSRANAARVLRAFGKPVPEAWGIDPAKGAA